MESHRGEKNEYFDVNADQSSLGFYVGPVGRTERKKDKKMKDLLAPERPNHEPPVVVQTSDAYILEDGFRWRKYGQNACWRSWRCTADEK